MYTPSKLMLNKFRVVPVPKPRELFSRFGAVDSTRLSYSGEDLVSLSERKIDILNKLTKDLVDE